MTTKQLPLLFAVFLCVSFLTRALSLWVDVFDIDESAHIVGSWSLMRGELLYTDFVDNKPPLVYVYYALAQILFGQGMFSVHLLTLLFTVPLTALSASAFYNHSRTGITAGLIFLVYSAAFLAHDMLASNAEILMILPGAWALVMIRTEERALRFGNIACAAFLIGTGVLLKYQIVFWLPIIPLAAGYACLRTKAFARWCLLMATAAICFAIPLLITYAMFDLRGGSDALIYWTIHNNLAYSANPILLSEALERATSYLLPFLLVTGPLWWCWRRSIPILDSTYQVLLLSSLVLLSLPPALIGFRFYPHYFIQLYIPLSLVAAPYASLWTTAPLKGGGRIFLAYAILLLVGFTVANLLLYFGKSRVYRERDPVFQHIAHRLRTDQCFAGATLFVWGYAPVLYYRAGLKPASRFVVMPQSGLTGYISGNIESVRGKVPGNQYVRPAHWDWLLSDLEENKATYIIDTAPTGLYRWNQYPIHDYPRLRQYVDQKYQHLASIEGAVIYRRLGCNKP